MQMASMSLRCGRLTSILSSMSRRSLLQIVLLLKAAVRFARKFDMSCLQSGPCFLTNKFEVDQRTPSQQCGHIASVCVSIGLYMFLVCKFY